MEKEIEKIRDNIINNSKNEELVRSLIIGDMMKEEKASWSHKNYLKRQRK